MDIYFENLIVWKKELLIEKNIYICIKKFTSEEQYVLIDKMKRYDIYIVRNIEE